MAYYVRLPYAASTTLWDNDFLIFENKVAKFLADNDLPSYTDSMTIAFENQSDMHLFLLNFPQFCQITP